MNGATNVLVVAHGDDLVAIRLKEALEAHGRHVAHVDGPTAARLFTIRVRPGVTSVSPSIPMFLRASAWWCGSLSTPDERFLRSEEFATFWAAAALSEACVVNRPSRSGFTWVMTYGELARAAGDGRSNAEPEIFASTPKIIEDQVGSIWAEDNQFRVAPLAELGPELPVRARRIEVITLYEVIAVVGNRAFSTTTDPRGVELDLVNRSIKIANEVSLNFVTVLWAIDSRGAIPVRLNAAPDMLELSYVWPEVASALCLELDR